MKILTVIPARGGSKRIPKKNIKNFCGKPLIAWTIEHAIKAKFLNKIIVSTDDSQIAEISKYYGADIPFMRPKKLSCDQTPSIDVILDILHFMEGYDWLLLLQPTSPLRNNFDIDNMIKFCCEKNSMSCVSVSLTTNKISNIYTIDSKNLISKLDIKVNEIDNSSLYQLNGAIYFSNIKWLKKNKSFITNETLAYLMPQERSIDIDTNFDWKLATCLMGHLVQ